MSMVEARSGRRWHDWLLAAAATVMLVVCLGYFFLCAFMSPYPGFDYDAQWHITAVDAYCLNDPSRCVKDGPLVTRGDRLLVIDSGSPIAMTLTEYQANRLAVPFSGYRENDWVPITFERQTTDGPKIYTVSMQINTLRLSERIWRPVGVSFVLPFWLAGSLALLFLRPRDLRWFLVVTANYLTAVWISAGIFSSNHFAGSSLVLHVVSWLMLPAFLHLHLFVPEPLGSARRRRALVVGIYAAGLLGASAELFQLLPATAFYIGMLLAIGGSLALLVYRLLPHPLSAGRLPAAFMLLGVALGFGPGLIVSVVPGLLQVHNLSATVVNAVTFAGLPLQPLFYLYVTYKRQMGNLEFRANRLLSVYSFIMIFGIGFLIVFLAGGERVNLSPQGLAFALLVSTVFVVLAVWLRPSFQRLIDRLVYGTEHNPDTIIRTFANQIPRALDRDALARLLTREVSPALLIRQSALYLTSPEPAAVVYTHGIEPYAGGDMGEQLASLLRQGKRYLSPGGSQTTGGPFGWVRLVIPIEVGGKVIAAWLLGKRDPDDYYPQPDIELLTTLGNQVAVALETARLIESLQRRASELETAYRDLQRLDELKDEFVQNVSHELRTPLTFLRGYADLLLEELLGPINSSQREALQTISDRTEGIVRLVNDIISVQQANAESAVEELVNLPALARSCVEAAEIAAPKREAGQPVHSFSLVLADNVPPILGDRRRLAQVIDNLLGNAVKFSPRGGNITVRVVPCPYQPPGQLVAGISTPGVAIEVTDHGVGIPQGEIGRIWERFYQVDGSSTRRFGGMGLGLAIVRGIVEAHGGYVQVESQVDQGSSFRVVFPVAQPVQVPALAPDSPSHGTGLAKNSALLKGLTAG